MAATVYKARVWETAAVTGTGTVALTGAAQPGYRSFGSCVPSGSLVAYCIYDATAQVWETGIGTFTITTAPAGTLTRGLSESSTGSLISFVGNACNVTLDMISPVQVSAGAASAGLVPVLNAEGQIDGSMVVASTSAFASIMISTFQNSGRVNGLYIVEAADGINFSAPPGVINPVFTFPSTGGQGVSSGTWASAVMLYAGKYWLAYEFNNGVNASGGSNNLFGIASAPALSGPWTWVTDVAMAGTTAQSTNVWNPRWFIDDDGSIHVIANVEAGVPYNSAFQPVIVSALNSPLTSWSAPATITGSFPSNIIDTYMVSPANSPNGKYNLWFKDEVTLYVGYATSASRSSGFTVVESGNWAAWGQGEGPMLAYLGGTHWRLYLDLPNGGSLNYSDSYDGWATWTAATPINVPGISPGTGSIIWAGAGSQLYPGGVQVNGVAAAGKFLRGNGTAFVPAGILAEDLPEGFGAGVAVEQNGETVVGTATVQNFIGSGVAISGAAGTAQITIPVYMPLVNGDLPGPTPISDGFGQFIMVPV